MHEQVQLREEHVNVQRRPVDRSASPAEFNAVRDGATIELRETAEEPVVGKTARVVGKLW